MSECATSCPYILNKYEVRASIQDYHDAQLRRASGIQKLIFMDQDERQKTLEVFSDDLEAAASFLGDGRAKLTDIIDAVPEKAKADYIQLDGMLLKASIMAIENSEHAIEHCDANKPIDEVIAGRQMKVCHSEFVKQLMRDNCGE